MVRPGRLIGTLTDAIRPACDRYRKTRTHGTEGRVPVSDGPIPIEWGNDLESLEFKWTDWRGSEQEARAKGRCTRCWGGLVGRNDDHHQITGIKCRVCGETLEGEAAREEHSRMFNETGANLENVSAGRLPRYADDRIFVFKTFPMCERMPPEDFRARVARSKATPGTSAKIDRNDFPSGSAGYFVLQATTLMASVEGIAHPHATSVLDFPAVRIRDDGTAIWTVSVGGIVDDIQFRERRLLRNLGETLTAAMISAFSCELAMKAISLTVNDQALKTHDLKRLYDDLPEPSRCRVEADYPGIVAALDAGRQTFGTWRYFETNVGETVAQALIDTEQARNLGKAARVILDEAEMVGLGYKVNVTGQQDVRVSNGAESYRHNLTIDVTGREAPPSHDPVPAAHSSTYPFPPS